jgi:hypothetical protein
MINTKELKLSTTASGEEIWVCGHCGKPAQEAETIDGKGHTSYTLMCPLGRITLGEWPSLEEKELQLAAYTQALKK